MQPLSSEEGDEQISTILQFCPLPPIWRPSATTPTLQVPQPTIAIEADDTADEAMTEYGSDISTDSYDDIGVYSDENNMIEEALAFKDVQTQEITDEEVEPGDIITDTFDDSAAGVWNQMRGNLI